MPELRVQDWAGTRDALHLWTQIVGKIRMAHAPMLNHWWQVTLYVTPRGLTTSSIPYGHGAFDMEFDFCEHILRLRTSNGMSTNVNLSPKSVAEFQAETFDALSRLGIETAIGVVPNEVEPAIPFAEDYLHGSYDSEAVRLFWHQLIQADRLLNAFRSYFRGKVSPVHSSGEEWIWPARGSPAGRRPDTLEGPRNAATGSWRRLNPTKSAAAVSGPAAGTRVRFMPTTTVAFVGSVCVLCSGIAWRGVGVFVARTNSG